MSEHLDRSEYCSELNRKLDEVIAWAVLNCPINGKNLAYADFEKVITEFRKVATEESELQHMGNQTQSQSQGQNQNQPEPEEGGPQYINDNPAPWP